MPDRERLLSNIRDAVATAPEPHRAVAALIRESGPFRWVGLYVVDGANGVVCNVVWDGPSAPSFPLFPLTAGLTASAVAERKTVNVGDVQNDSRYLTALGSTRSEIIVPIFDPANEIVVGTIDVESDQLNAFNAEVQSLFEACAEILKPLWART